MGWNKRSWKQTGRRGGRGHLEGVGEKCLNQAGWGDLEGSLGNRNPVRRPHMWPESTLPLTLHEACVAEEKGPTHFLSSHCLEVGYCEAEQVVEPHLEVPVGT